MPSREHGSGNMKIWFFYAEAGGGHKAPAKALAEEIQKTNAKIQIEFVNLTEKVNIFFKKVLEEGYSFLIHQTPGMYALLYELSKRRFIIWLEYRLGEIARRRSIRQQIIDRDPSVIISTYYLISPIKSVLEELKKATPVYVLVTDPFSAPPIWFYYKDVKYIVSSERVRQIALENGVSQNNVKVFPQILNHSTVVHNSDSAKRIKEAYGLLPSKKTIVIVGGGIGFPGGKIVIKELINSDIDAEFVIICGKNEKYQRDVEKMVRGAKKKILVFGFVNNITEIISLADLVITKAGAGVVWETLLSKKPVLITRYIYGQEKGNMQFVVENGVGWYEPKIKRAIRIVQNYLNSEEEEKRIRNNFEKLNLQSGNKQIAEYIMGEILSDNS